MRVSELRAALCVEGVTYANEERQLALLRRLIVAISGMPDPNA
jgi:hypothetical protein